MVLWRRSADRRLGSGKLPDVKQQPGEPSATIAVAEMGAALRQLRRAIEQAQEVVAADDEPGHEH